ncbi:hypothetical protein [Bdellovibrio sp. HCB288]|uniref:hypothetical protein n=1 Tax=Bdellovibrio sp. HCB288 TaxID=3394355 RepID=UPI0039B54820
MAVNVVFNGVTYSIPTEGDTDWGPDLSSYFVSLANNTLQKSGGNFFLTNELNFGPNFGLRGAYFRSSSTSNPAAVGFVRLGNGQLISWRNADNSADLSLQVDAGNNLNFNGASLSVGGTPVQPELTFNDTSTIDLDKTAGIVTAEIKALSIDNSLISNAAAIAYSKLNLSNSMMDSDVAANADIALSKLAALTASKVVISNASGVLTDSTITSTELSWLSGLTTNVESALSSLNASVVALGTNKADVSALSAHIADNANPHAVTKTQVGLGNVDNTSDVTKNAAAVVLTNKDIDGGVASNTRRITLPKDTKANLDALTRKAGTVVYGTDTGKPYYDDGLNLKLIGSGSGGSVNYVTDGDAEGSNPFVVSKNTVAGSTPDSGFVTSGTNITVTQSATDPLSGTKSFILTKDAANRQGEQASVPFTIDAKDKAKVLTINIDNIVGSGTFAAGNPSDRTATGNSDVTVWIYDVTNGVFTQPSTYRFYSNSSTLADRFIAQFQTASNSTSYKLVLHVASTSASAFTLKFECSVTPSDYVYGTPITDWQITNDLTVFGLTTSTSYQYSRRVGDSMQYRYLGILNAAATAMLRIQVNKPIDGTKLRTDQFQNVGAALGFDANGSFYSGTVVIDTGNANSVSIMGPNLSSRWNAASPFTWASTDMVSLDFTLPIVGLSSSVQMSDSADTRVVSFIGNKSVNQAVTANTTNISLTTVKDSHGAWNGTDTYVVPVTGDYNVSGVFLATGAGTDLAVYINGALKRRFIGVSTTTVSSGSSIIENLKAGDLLTIKSVTTTTILGNAEYAHLSISRISGPSAIAATELIAASYWASAHVSASTTQPINFDSKEFDTHGAVTTGSGWRFTAPAAGIYEISLSTAYLIAGSTYFIIYKNASAYKGLGYSQVSTSAFGVGTTLLELKAGEHIDIRPDTGATVTGGNLSAGPVARINIKRVGL